MRSPLVNYGWNPIESAPFDEDILVSGLTPSSCSPAASLAGLSRNARRASSRGIFVPG
jgi:hypothetical protein